MGKPKYDFIAWATKNNVRCADGRTIMKDAFKDCDGKTVPLLWNHDHGDPMAVVGHALLKNQPEGVLSYCSFNDSELGKHSKLLVDHGDINAVSIWANQLVENNGYVSHGNIRELSLVLAGANPEASIQYVVSHDGIESTTEAEIYTNERIELYHGDDDEEHIEHTEDSKDAKEKTIGDVLDTLSEEQQTAVAALVGMIAPDEEENTDEEDTDEQENNDSKGGSTTVKHNVFDMTHEDNKAIISHSDEESILRMAKDKGVGSFRSAFGRYIEDHKDTLSHGFEDVEQLFPDYEDIRPGTPETITRDYSWVDAVISGAHKSPFSRVRTRQFDATAAELRANGYQKGKYKNEMGLIKQLRRTTDPQTIYIKEAMHRDDIVDITDFDAVNYMKNIMRGLLNEEIALDILIGDQRDEADEHKVYQQHIRSIWLDDEFYAIHKDVDFKAAAAELQGTNTGANFGENYIKSEAIITASLYAKEEYKGSGNVLLFCAPHWVNVMLLAKDLNGRRIYSSKADLAAALDVSRIITVEQFSGKQRTTTDSKTKELIGIFVNMADYTIGSTKGGKVTSFNQFDIDFNQEKYLMETRLSGALSRYKSAIVLEEDVTE